MKYLYIYFIVISNVTYAQLYNLYYIKIDSGKFYYDTLSNSYSIQFMNNYSGKNYSKAISYLDSLCLNGKNDFKIDYNKAICYKKLNYEDSAYYYASKYIHNQDISKILIGLIKKSILFDNLKSDEMLIDYLNNLEKIKYKSLTKLDFAYEIEYRDALEQEILMDTMYYGNNNLKDKYFKLKKNADPIIYYLDNNINFPTIDEIGNASNLLFLIILHMDYDPENQYILANKLLDIADINNYPKGKILYCIDRSLKNQNKKQKYGSIIINRSLPDAKIYKYKGSQKKINKLRAKYNLVPIEEEIKNQQINKEL